MWRAALLVLTEYEPLAFWWMANGAVFWWTPARSELLHDRFATEQFLFSEIEKIQIKRHERIGKEDIFNDLPTLEQKLRPISGLKVDYSDDTFVLTTILPDGN